MADIGVYLWTVRNRKLKRTKLKQIVKLLRYRNEYVCTAEHFYDKLLNSMHIIYYIITSYKNYFTFLLVVSYLINY